MGIVRLTFKFSENISLFLFFVCLFVCFVFSFKTVVLLNVMSDPHFFLRAVNLFLEFLGFTDGKEFCLRRGYSQILRYIWASMVARRKKRLPGMRETRVRSLSWEDPLVKEMATHSSTLAWRIPWRERYLGLWG